MRPTNWLTLYVIAAAGCGQVSTTETPDAAAGMDAGNGALALARPDARVAQKASTPIDFTISRDPTLTGALTVHVSGLPAGVTADDVMVAADATTGMFVVQATTSSAVAATTNVNVELLDGTRVIDQDPLAIYVAGAPGTIDTSFGNAGRTTVPLPDPAVATASGNGYARGVAVYPPSAGANAGKVVIGVSLDTTGSAATTFKGAVVRLNPDGTPDSSFGTGGYVLVNPGASHAFQPISVAIDSQGRIVLLSYRVSTIDECSAHVVRLTPSGAIDSSFTTFDQTAPLGYCGTPRSVAVIGNDKLVVLSTWNNPDYSARPLLMQINSNGTPDNTAFSGSFAVRLPNPGATKPTLHSNKLAVDSQGRYLISGHKCEGGWSAGISACESVVGRITAAGAWDTTFGTAGTGNLGYSSLSFGSGSTQSFGSLALDANGTIVAVGWSEGSTTATLARFATDGSLDTSFGTSGRITPVLVAGGTSQALTDVAVDEDGRIVAAGYVSNGSPLIVTSRYSSTGTLDAGYGALGVQTAPAGALVPVASLQADGRFVVAGCFPRTGGGYDVTAWRFWP